jgi:hypothetical protein
MTLPRGLHDQLLTTALRQRITAEGVHAVIDPLKGAESTHHLLDLVGRRLGDVLESHGSDDQDSIARQAELIAHLLGELR